MAGRFEHKLFGDINLDDSFFDDLKRDYPEFESSWFPKCVREGRKALVFSDEQGLGAFIALKEENQELNLVNYYKGAIPDKLTMLYNNKVKTHWAWLTSCGLINVEPYILLVNENINSLVDFSRYHIGRNIKI